MASTERFIVRSIRELIDRDQLDRLLKPSSLKLPEHPLGEEKEERTA